MNSRQREVDLRDPESGMVTVELALGLGSLFLVLALVLTAVGAATSRAELCDRVRQGARAYSLGAPIADSHLSVREEGKSFTVFGSKPAVGLGGWSVGTIECQVSGTLENTIPWAQISDHP